MDRKTPFHTTIDVNTEKNTIFVEMRRLLFILCLLCAVSCNWISGKREVPEPVPEEEQAEEAQVDEEDPLASLGKILDGLKELAEKAVEKGWIDTTSVEEAPEPEELEEEAEEEVALPQAPDEWYDHDFALSFTYHQYVGAQHYKAGDFTMYYTRIGNKVYLHKPGQAAEDSVLEFHEDGTRTFTYYLSGIKMRSNKKEGDAHKYLRHQFTDVGNCFNAILASHPDISRAQKETTISGRPVAIIHTEKDEDILTQHVHTEKDYYVDKEYHFLYKTVGNGSGGGMTIKNGCTWEVTYFTDKPTKKDIHLVIREIPKTN